ncbi:MAG: hypothetical protein ABIW79_07320 [Gemmatimonas sp.]
MSIVGICIAALLLSIAAIVGSALQTTAATMPRWRYCEALGYVRKIDINHGAHRPQRAEVAVMSAA